jgi:hypothetical protein
MELDLQPVTLAVVGLDVLVLINYLLLVSVIGWSIIVGVITFTIGFRQAGTEALP